MPKRGRLKIYFGCAPHRVLLSAVKEAGKYRADGVPRAGEAVISGLADFSPRGRHMRRADEAEELLAAGTDVAATLRVTEIAGMQSLLPESLRAERNTVSDALFDGAAEVVLVDEPAADAWESALPAGEYAEIEALRELALVRAAERLSARSERTGEEVLVCVGPSPTCRTVIERAARLSRLFHARLTALYVETSRSARLPEEAKERLADNLAAAEKLGARVCTVFGEDIPSAVTEFAREGGITKVVLGRTRSVAFRRAPLVERLLKLSPGLDVYIIPESGKKHLRPFEPPRMSAKAGLLSAAALAVTTALCFGLDALGVSHLNIGILYFLCALGAAAAGGGKAIAALSALAGTVLLHYFFVDPAGSLSLGRADVYVTYAAMTAGAVTASVLAAKLRSQARAAAGKAVRTQILLDATSRLQAAGSRGEAAAALCAELSRLTGGKVFYFPREGEDTGKPYCSEDAAATAAERACAKRCLAEGEEFRADGRTYFPVKGGEGTIGAAVFSPPGDPFAQSLVYAVLSAAAVAEEKLRLARKGKEAELSAERERLSANILRAVSHDLRTPLTAISGSAAMLAEGGLSEETQKSLASDIAEDAAWLIRMVENLLSVSKMEGGKPRLNLQPELLEEVAESALAHARMHRQTETCFEELLLARMDAPLIAQVIANFLDNADKFSPEGAPVRLSAFRKGGRVYAEVADEGRGVPRADRERIFDMFYSSEISGGDGRRGFGLGLALARSIVEAHGGEIYVRDNAPCGAVFGFGLDAEEVKDETH